MTKQTIDNQEIDVQFFHQVKGKNEKTRVNIYVGDPGTLRENKACVADVSVRRHSKDTPNRVVARCSALRKALAESGLSENQRNAIWGMIRKPKRVSR